MKTPVAFGKGQVIGITQISGGGNSEIFLTPPEVSFCHLISLKSREGLMAYRKEEKNKTSKNQSSGKHMSESSPNPHGESKILKMPINTDQRNATGGRNVPQVPNTVGGKLNPSVAHEFKGRVLSTDAKSVKSEDNAKRIRAPQREKSVAIFDSSKFKKKDA
jgi:hypothetical protein